MNICKNFRRKRFMRLFERYSDLEVSCFPHEEECPICRVIAARQEIVYPPRIKKKMARIAKQMDRLYPLLK